LALFKIYAGKRESIPARSKTPGRQDRALLGRRILDIILFDFKDQPQKWV